MHHSNIVTQPRYATTIRRPAGPPAAAFPLSPAELRRIVAELIG